MMGAGGGSSSAPGKTSDTHLLLGDDLPSDDEASLMA